MEKPILVLMNGMLRLADHPAFAAAVESGRSVVPVYVYDDKQAWALGGASKWWLLQSLESLSEALKTCGSELVLIKGPVLGTLLDLAKEVSAGSVYLTRGYSANDRSIEQALHEYGEQNELEIRRFAGRLLLEPEQVVSKSGTPYSVFTPFWRQARELIANVPPLPSPKKIKPPKNWPFSLHIAELGLDPKPAFWAEPLAGAWQPGEASAQKRLQGFVTDIMMGYQKNRDTPGIDGTSKLSPYLAFGEISPRQIWHTVRAAMDEQASDAGDAMAYLRELGWREFCYHQLFYNPDMPDKPLKKPFARFPWQEGFGSPLEAWQQGQTGFPIIDAGMRQLWQTGWVHNRVRMVVASFLVKDLLWHWRDGEAWFWDTLVDADLANNAAGWQWVAGCGADAAPYFRIFNPILQGEKFDKNGDYIRTFVPELKDLPNAYIHKPFEAPAGILEAAGVKLGQTYPTPIIDRKQSRARALSALRSIKD